MCIISIIVYHIYLLYIINLLYFLLQKNASVMNTICINSFRYTHVITSTKFRLKQTWRLTKAIAEMKCDTEQTMKLE